MSIGGRNQAAEPVRHWQDQPQPRRGTCRTPLAVTCLTLLATCLLDAGGCKKNTDNRDNAPLLAPANSAAPITTPTPTPSQPPAPTPPPPPMPRIDEMSAGLRNGWLMIDEVSDRDHTAWVEGRVEDGEKLVIDTENIERFQLDLSRIRLDWDKRIVLRIDGFNRELTRKNFPHLNYERTSTGGWRLIDD